MYLLQSLQKKYRIIFNRNFVHGNQHKQLQFLVLAAAIHRMHKTADSKTGFSFDKLNRPKVTALLHLYHSLFTFYQWDIHSNFHTTTADVHSNFQSTNMTINTKACQ